MGTVAGAVLTGGAGRRIGGGKPLVEYRGVALGTRVATALQGAGCRPVVAVGGSIDELTPLGLDVVVDRWPGEGPLGGLVTACAALLADSVDAVIVAACDLGRLDSATVGELIVTDPSADVVVAYGTQRHASLVRCSPAAAAAAERSFLAGERRLSRLLEDATLRILDCRVDEQRMANINAPADLDR